MRKLIFIILLVSFSAIFYYFVLDHENSIVQQTVSEVKKVFKKTPLSQAHNTTATNNGEAVESESESVKKPQASIDSLQNLSSDEIKKWVAIESRSMDSASNNTEEKQIKLKAQARVLNFQQLKVLKELAVNSSLAINERILSAYLISLNPTVQSQESLFEIAKSEVPDFGPILPHSEAELKHTQEMAIRYMQIDELFERAKTDVNAYDKLKLLVQEASSSQVRSYALKKIQELK